eukprot:1899381-Amphidinium_carterae.1
MSLRATRTPLAQKLRTRTVSVYCGVFIATVSCLLGRHCHGHSWQSIFLCNQADLPKGVQGVCCEGGIAAVLRKRTLCANLDVVHVTALAMEASHKRHCDLAC